MLPNADYVFQMFRLFETEGIAILTMLVSKFKIEIKDEPEFSAETFEEKKTRILRGRQGITLTFVLFSIAHICLAKCSRISQTHTYAFGVQETLILITLSRLLILDTQALFAFI